MTRRLGLFRVRPARALGEHGSGWNRGPLTRGCSPLVSDLNTPPVIRRISFPDGALCHWIFLPPFFRPRFGSLSSSLNECLWSEWLLDTGPCSRLTVQSPPLPPRGFQQADGVSSPASQECVNFCSRPPPFLPLVGWPPLPRNSRGCPETLDYHFGAAAGQAPRASIQMPTCFYAQRGITVLAFAPQFAFFFRPISP